MKFWVALVCSIPALWAGDASVAHIRDAAAKGLAVIQHGQQNWYHKQSCISCHQQIFPAMAFRAAREHGIPLDEAAAHTADAQAFGYFSDFKRAVEYTNIIDPSLNDGYAMIAANAAGVRPSLVTAVYARLLAARQAPDGRWESADERPPESYSAHSPRRQFPCAPFNFTRIRAKRPKLQRGPYARAPGCFHTSRRPPKSAFIN